jgi:predicted Zn finger-like uncharacterized protein
MLIVCPSCATSYDQTAVGLAGRTVRCTRCKASWFAGGPEAAPEMSAAADNMTLAAEPPSVPPARNTAPPVAAATDNPGAENSESIAAAETQAPSIEPRPPQSEPSPAEVQSPDPAEILAPEAAPVLIPDAPPLAPPVEYEEPPAAAESEPETEEAESFDLRRRWLQIRRKQSHGSPRWTAIILVLVAFDLALVGARTVVVRALPQTATLFAAIGLPVNLRHLQFEQVSISKEAQDGVPTLIVQGAIVSEAGKPVAVPHLRFAARNAAGQEVYTWTTPPPLSILEPGARTEFRSQVATPPVEARDVLVRFLSANDAGAK